MSTERFRYLEIGNNDVGGKTNHCEHCAHEYVYRLNEGGGGGEAMGHTSFLTHVTYPYVYRTRVAVGKDIRVFNDTTRHGKYSERLLITNCRLLPELHDERIKKWHGRCQQLTQRIGVQTMMECHYLCYMVLGHRLVY